MHTVKRRTILPVLICVLAAFSCAKVAKQPSLEQGDWPQYRADCGRTGYTPSELPENLALRWKRVQEKPTPAWRGVHTRMTFDYAYEPVVSGGTLFFGSSTDCAVYAVDTDTGRERWSFVTDAPVRFAPVIWKDRVIVGSDDGNLYCLSGSSGKVVWLKPLAPGDGMVIGNDRMVSRWPLRGGPVVRDGVLYAGAGIWPTEGITLYALDPDTGGELWVNGDSGSIEMNQPHGGARAVSGISSQGYLLSAGDRLFVPTGRAVPAALDIATGEFLYFHLQKHRTYGGSRVMAADDMLFVASGNTNDGREIIGGKNALFSADTGELTVREDVDARAMAVSPEHVLYVDASTGALTAIDRSKPYVKRDVTNRRGETVQQAFLSNPAWSVPTDIRDAVSLIAAGNHAIIGSAAGRIAMVDMEAKKVVWTGDVDGAPYGLAAARGRLYVATDTGSMYCFDGSGTKKPEIVGREIENYPYGSNDVFARAAEAIVAETGITEGWCLDTGCGDGALAYELVKRTNLYVIAMDPDPINIGRARKRLRKAGIYGSRVVVHKGDYDEIGYPEYFADLIVSDRSVLYVSEAPDKKSPAPATSLSRLLRPYGGVACFGPPDGMSVTKRGGLPGAGEWKHLYHDPGNTITSEDDLVREGLEVLWYKDDRFDVPSRHGRGVGPLFSEGRLFVQGMDAIRCYNAYNGRVLWEYATPAIQSLNDYDHALGAAVTHQNWCIDGDRLYIRIEKALGTSAGRHVVALDTATGSEVARYDVPAIEGLDFLEYWGWLAVVDGTIYGTVANYDHTVNWGWGTYDTHKLFSESVALFALDAATGDMKWLYKAKDSIRHNAIAIGGDRLYLIDRPVAVMDRKMIRPSGFEPSDHPNGVLVALDTENGDIIYRKRGGIYGTLLAYSAEHDVLVMTYQFTRFAMSSEFGGRMSGFRAADGNLLWSVETGIDGSQDYSYSSRPIVNGRTIYLEPLAWDLLTGEKLDFRFEHSYTCGIVAAARNMLVYRSATLGYLDLDRPELGTQNYGGIRPGCWLNAIPAGGLVLMPDATDRCNCSYLVKATIALKPKDVH